MLMLCSVTVVTVTVAAVMFVAGTFVAMMFAAVMFADCVAVWAVAADDTVVLADVLSMSFVAAAAVLAVVTVWNTV